MRSAIRIAAVCLSFLFILIGCESGKPSSPNNEAEDLVQKSIELATKFIITDGHVDLPYRLREQMEDVSVRSKSGDFDYVRAKSGGLDAPFMSIYIPSELEGTEEAKTLADSLIGLVKQLTVDHPDKFALATTPDDVRENFKSGQISFPMGMENGAPILGDLQNLQHYYDQGIRYITLTHAHDNHICDSSYDTTRTWNGLSPFGIKVIEGMNTLGIMVDVSHISDSAFFKAIAITKAPVIASHSSCRRFTPGWERNMSDDMIRALAKNGGVIQINFGSVFLDHASNQSWDKIDAHNQQWLKDHQLTEDDPEAKAYTVQYSKANFVYTDVGRVADHIDHVVMLVGVDHVAFGSDFDGVGDSLPEGLKDVSDYPNLILELLERGYSEEDIEKICSGNVFRVWDQVIQVSDEIQFGQST